MEQQRALSDLPNNLASVGAMQPGSPICPMHHGRVETPKHSRAQQYEMSWLQSVEMCRSFMDRDKSCVETMAHLCLQITVSRFGGSSSCGGPRCTPKILVSVSRQIAVRFSLFRCAGKEPTVLDCGVVPTHDHLSKRFCIAAGLVWL